MSAATPDQSAHHTMLSGRPGSAGCSSTKQRRSVVEAIRQVVASVEGVDRLRRGPGASSSVGGFVRASAVAPRARRPRIGRTELRR